METAKIIAVYAWIILAPVITYMYGHREGTLEERYESRFRNRG